MRLFTIQTLLPAEVTFPSEVRKILILNNTVAQPGNIGYEYSLLGIRQDSAKVNAKIANDFACRELGNLMADSPFFDDILLYEGDYRTDNDFLTNGRLNQEEVRSICEDTGADAIISLDRMLYQSTRTIHSSGEGVYKGNILIVYDAMLRIYTPGKAGSLAAIALTDSILWEDYGLSTSVLNEYYLPPQDTAIKIAAGYFADKALTFLVPHWNDDTRWVYKKGTSRWKDASTLASKEKWSDARAIWMQLFDRTKNNKDQSKLASNIAISYELESRYDEALQWAEKSYDLIKGNLSPDDDDDAQMEKLQKIYVDVLRSRMQGEQKLDMQLEYIN